MLTTLVFALTALFPSPNTSAVSPSCEVRLDDVHEARRTLGGLHRSERHFRRKFARAQTRGERRAIERVLLPIANQARALEDEVDRRERAYIRCIEAQLDARARRVTRGVAGTTCGANPSG